MGGEAEGEANDFDTTSVHPGDSDDVNSFGMVSRLLLQLSKCDKFNGIIGGIMSCDHALITHATEAVEEEDEAEASDGSSVHLL